MKQITVISGKGGTGKTTITAAFASLAKNAVFADCDVDAADLHLILKPKVLETKEFQGLKLAVKDDDICTSCGQCYERCRFDAGAALAMNEVARSHAILRHLGRDRDLIAIDWSPGRAHDRLEKPIEELVSGGPKPEVPQGGGAS